MGYATPGTMHAWPAGRIAEGNVHFGGTETARSWVGSLEGGAEAGCRSAVEVLRAIRPQSLCADDLEVIWSGRDME